MLTLMVLGGSPWAWADIIWQTVKPKAYVKNKWNIMLSDDCSWHGKILRIFYQDLNKVSLHWTQNNECLTKDCRSQKWDASNPDNCNIIFISNYVGTLFLKTLTKRIDNKNRKYIGDKWLISSTKHHNDSQSQSHHTCGLSMKTHW